MPEKRDINSEEKAWKNYLLSIEKTQQKPAKKGISIGQRFKAFLESVGIGRPKKSIGEEIKKQVEISAKEARKRPAAAIPEKQPAVKGIYEKPKISTKPTSEKLKEKTVEKKWEKPAEKIEKMHAEKKGPPSRMEKYIARIEKRQEEEKKVKELEKQLEEKRKAKEKKKKFVKKVEKGISKKISILPKKKKGKKEHGVSKKISFMPKAEKKKAVKGKKIKIVPKAKTKPEEIISEKDIAKFFKPEPSLAKKSVEEIKKLSPKQIKKEVRKARIAKKARGWYGNSLKHKKAAVSGWRLRKRIKLHHLKKKEKTASLTDKEKKAKKRLIHEDRQLRLKIQKLEQKIRSLKNITKKKNKESKTFEKKIKAVGLKIPKTKELAIEKEETIPKGKEDIRQIVQVMKKIADEMAITASSQRLVDIEKEEAIPIEDRIKAQEKLIKNLERAFYKRKIDFNQFREKMFDYQSKLTELKIRKKMKEDRIAKMTPEERQLREKRIAARKKRTGIGLTLKTAEALEKIATAKEKKGLEKKTAEAIKKLSEKETEREAREKEEKRFVEKTASALERIAAKIGGIQGKRPEKEDKKPAAMPEAAGKKPTAVEPAAKAEEKLAKKAKEAVSGARPAQPQPIMLPYTGKAYPGKAQPDPYRPSPAPPARKERKKGKSKRKAGIDIKSQAGAPTYESNVYQGAVYQHRPSERPGRVREGMPMPAADFYDEEPVKKKGFLGKIKERVVSRQKPVAPEVDKAIREKAAKAHPAVSKEQIDRVEQKLGQLLQKYNIPNKVLAEHIKTLDNNRLVNDFQKLINLIETKRGGATTELIRPAPGFDINTGIISKKKERIVGKEKEIRRAKIETSFDKVLNLVQVKGIINVNDAAKQLGMKKKDLQECAEILERSSLIKLSYPPIGSVKLICPAYLKWKLAEKKKKREAKRKKKR